MGFRHVFLNIFSSPIQVEPQIFELFAVVFPLIFGTQRHDPVFQGFWSSRDFKRLFLSVIYNIYTRVGINAL